jgi:hypothetical protein
MVGDQLSCRLQTANDLKSPSPAVKNENDVTCTVVSVSTSTALDMNQNRNSIMLPKLHGGKAVGQGTTRDA